MNSESIFHGAMKPEEEHRRDICVVGRWIKEHGFAASTDGNISVRLGPNRILVTPTRMSKGMMAPDDLVVTDLTGRRLGGLRQASSELGMHLMIYRLRPEVNAVCHAHPPYATGFAVAGMALDKPLLCEMVMDLGCVPLAHYGTPGTSELAEAIEPLVPGHDAILMANHGVVTCGYDLLTAFQRMETTEHFAHVAFVSELLGRQNLLTAADLEKLEARRVRHVAREAAGTEHDSAHAEYPNDAAADRVTLTRRELESLIDEAIQKDRAHR